MQLAVQAIQLGAQDFLGKPWENARVRSLATNHLALTSTRAQLQRLAEIRQQEGADYEPVFQSRAMREVMEVAARVAASAAPVLLTGESEIFYTLKEAQVLIERWRHYYNHVRPHSALGYRPPAPETKLPRIPIPSIVESVTMNELTGLLH